MGVIPLISLDTNVFIFGLRQLYAPSLTILENLPQFHVKISLQVRRELHNNLSSKEISILHNYQFLSCYRFGFFYSG